ncbi:DUF3945 domain-containing protein [Dysgonomonas sp. GY75]|uniref:DUF3945 domain-containing protein n=1 Tax=Dysgonomonas sp. GY75 TaxID=2780419 RepID=UPI00188441FE|nr:DUF3945 domain-containing protein [Dysgonomonas sp. GY75]MBF0651541.1 DUF3945 domain-containing protein [Dysgonomonas sp. GY75]
MENQKKEIIKKKKSPSQERGAQKPEAQAIIVMDKEAKTLEAVKTADAEKGVKTVPATKERQNEFLQVGHISDPLDILITMVRNFYSQARAPTSLEIFRIPFSALEKGVGLLAGYMNGIGSEAARAFADKYRAAVISNKSALENSNNKKNVTMENQKNPQDTVPENNTDRKNRFMPSQINWDELKSLGITKEYLEQKGLLDQLLQGRKTNQLIPISIRQGGAHVTSDAKLSLRQEQDGSVSLRIHGVKKEPELDRLYFGHVFTLEDKKNLLETGHLGRTVDLYDRTNNTYPAFISIDPLTKEIASVRLKGIYIPEEVSGIRLLEHEKDDLYRGKEIFIEGMIAKSGKEFNAYLRVDANERRVTYRFEEGLANIRKIGGVELNDAQRNDLQAGKAILVEGMVNKQTGELRDSYVKAPDLATGKLQFSNFNPDSPEEKREIIIPRYVGQVLLTREDREELASGKAVFIKDQVRASGETYDSFVRLHPATGDIQRSRTPDGFSEEVKPEIPKEISGVKVTAKMRADIQDGKAVEIKGAKTPDGTKVPTFVKLNKDTNLLSFYRENPDQAKKATITAANTQQQAEQSRGTKIK